jgi:hypothetical protein
MNDLVLFEALKSAINSLSDEEVRLLALLYGNTVSRHRVVWPHGLDKDTKKAALCLTAKVNKLVKDNVACSYSDQCVVVKPLDEGVTVEATGTCTNPV